MLLRILARLGVNIITIVSNHLYWKEYVPIVTPKFSDDQDEILVEGADKHPSLWQLSHPKYKDQRVRQRLATSRRQSWKTESVWFLFTFYLSLFSFCVHISWFNEMQWCLIGYFFMYIYIILQITQCEYFLYNKAIVLSWTYLFCKNFHGTVIGLITTKLIIDSMCSGNKLDLRFVTLTLIRDSRNTVLSTFITHWDTASLSYTYVLPIYACNHYE